MTLPAHIDDRNSQPLISWLHLSDIHLGHGDRSHQLDQTLVLPRLLADIVAAAARGIPKPDMILVTGDIAFSGATRQADEYQRASEWLEKVAAAIGLSSENIYTVPGNHDVQRDVATKNWALGQIVDGLRSKRGSLDDALIDPSVRQMLRDRMSNYLAFAAKYAPVQRRDGGQGRLFWTDRHDGLGGLKLRLVGLNTALLCQGDDDQGKLFLGNEQIVQGLKELPANDELILVLSHHPFDWLGDKTNVESWVNSSSHIHMSGHVHVADSWRVISGGGGDTIRLVAGAVHLEASEVPMGHGYSMVSVVQRQDDQLALRIWPRRWSQRHRDFRVDYECVEDGQTSTTLALNLTLPKDATVVTPTTTVASPAPLAPLGAESASSVPTASPPPPVDVPVSLEEHLGRVGEDSQRKLDDPDIAVASPALLDRSGADRESSAYPPPTDDLPVRLKENLRQIEEDAQHKLDGLPDLLACLRKHLGLAEGPDAPGSREIVHHLLHEKRAVDVVNAINYCDDELAGPPPKEDERQALHSLLWMILPFAIDGRSQVGQVRRKIIAGDRVIELPFFTTTLAECILAGAEGRPMVLEQDVQSKRLLGRGAILPPPELLIPDVDGTLFRDRVVEDLANRLNVTAHDPAERARQVALAISAKIKSPPRDRIRYHLLFADHECGGSPETVWKIIVTSLGIDVPTLLLVRLSGDSKTSPEEIDLTEWLGQILSPHR